VKRLALCVLFLAGCQATPPAPPTPAPLPPSLEGVYKGTWHATNKRADGTMTATVTQAGAGKWRAAFTLTLGRKDVAFTVDWTGPAERLTGEATVDGRRVRWEGRLSAAGFSGTFKGERYTGTFDLHR
jgi:hypothetical protein